MIPTKAFLYFPTSSSLLTQKTKSAKAKTKNNGEKSSKMANHSINTKIKNSNNWIKNYINYV
jgi:hypothetical protein